MPTGDAVVIGPKLGEGREGEVYAWGADAVLKLYRPGFGGHDNETLALAALAGHGVAPELTDVIEHDGRTGLVMQRLHGSDLLALLERQPWQVHRFSRMLATTHLAVHRISSPSRLPDLREVLGDRIRDASLPAELERFALEVLDGLGSGDRLCHGDFHPGNVLMSAGQAGVIDWSAAARGTPQADHARTIMLLRWANPLPGTPLLFRALISGGRRMLASTYARTYRNRSPDPLQHLNSWLTVNIAARLSEGVDAERPNLLTLLNAAHRNARR